MPSPNAPWSVMLKLFAGMTGNGGSACATVPPHAATASAISNLTVFAPRDRCAPTISPYRHRPTTRLFLRRLTMVPEGTWGLLSRQRLEGHKAAFACAEEITGCFATELQGQPRECNVLVQYRVREAATELARCG